MKFCREQPFALGHTYSVTVVCLMEVILEHDTFACSPCQKLALIILLHVYGEKTVVSSVHWHINLIHLKRSLHATSCAQRKKANIAYGWLFGLIVKEKMFIGTLLQMLLICVCHFSC